MVHNVRKAERAEFFYVRGGRQSLIRIEKLLAASRIPVATKGQEYKQRPQVQVPPRFSKAAEAILKREGYYAGGPYPFYPVDLPELSVAEARERFADLLNDAAFNGERFLITRHGKAIAAIVPAEDAQYLQEREDQIDLAAVKTAYKELRRKGIVP